MREINAVTPMAEISQNLTNLTFSSEDEDSDSNTSVGESNASNTEDWTIIHELNSTSQAGNFSYSFPHSDASDVINEDSRNGDEGTTSESQFLQEPANHLSETQNITLQVPPRDIQVSNEKSFVQPGMPNYTNFNSSSQQSISSILNSATQYSPGHVDFSSSGHNPAQSQDSQMTYLPLSGHIPQTEVNYFNSAGYLPHAQGNYFNSTQLPQARLNYYNSNSYLPQRQPNNLNSSSYLPRGQGNYFNSCNYSPQGQLFNLPGNWNPTSYPVQRQVKNPNFSSFQTGGTVPRLSYSTNTVQGQLNPQIPTSIESIYPTLPDYQNSTFYPESRQQESNEQSSPQPVQNQLLLSLLQHQKINSQLQIFIEQRRQQLFSQLESTPFQPSNPNNRFHSGGPRQPRPYSQLLYGPNIRPEYPAWLQQPAIGQYQFVRPQLNNFNFRQPFSSISGQVNENQGKTCSKLQVETSANEQKLSDVGTNICSGSQSLANNSVMRSNNKEEGNGQLSSMGDNYRADYELVKQQVRGPEKLIGNAEVLLEVMRDSEGTKSDWGTALPSAILGNDGTGPINLTMDTSESEEAFTAQNFQHSNNCDIFSIIGYPGTYFEVTFEEGVTNLKFIELAYVHVDFYKFLDNIIVSSDLRSLKLNSLTFTKNGRRIMNEFDLLDRLNHLVPLTPKLNAFFEHTFQTKKIELSFGSDNNNKMNHDLSKPKYFKISNTESKMVVVELGSIFTNILDLISEKPIFPIQALFLSDYTLPSSTLDQFTKIFENLVTLSFQNVLFEDDGIERPTAVIKTRFFQSFKKLVKLRIFVSYRGLSLGKSPDPFSLPMTGFPPTLKHVTLLERAQCYYGHPLVDEEGHHFDYAFVSYRRVMYDVLSPSIMFTTNLQVNSLRRLNNVLETDAAYSIAVLISIWVKRETHRVCQEISSSGKRIHAEVLLKALKISPMDSNFILRRENSESPWYVEFPDKQQTRDLEEKYLVNFQF